MSDSDSGGEVEVSQAVLSHVSLLEIEESRAKHYEDRRLQAYEEGRRQAYEERLADVNAERSPSTSTASKFGLPRDDDNLGSPTPAAAASPVAVVRSRRGRRCGLAVDIDKEVAEWEFVGTSEVFSVLHITPSTMDFDSHWTFHAKYAAQVLHLPPSGSGAPQRAWAGGEAFDFVSGQWTRHTSALAESGSIAELYDRHPLSSANQIYSTMVLLGKQAARSPFEELVRDHIQMCKNLLKNAMLELDGLAELLPEAEDAATAALSQGRLLFAREDCYDAEAFVRSVLSVFEEMRVAVMMADTYDSVNAQLSQSVCSLRDVYQNLPVIAASAHAMSCFEGIALDGSQRRGLQDLVQARLVFEKLKMESLELGFFEDHHDLAISLRNEFDMLEYCLNVALRSPPHGVAWVEFQAGNLAADAVNHSQLCSAPRLSAGLSPSETRQVYALSLFLYSVVRRLSALLDPRVFPLPTKAARILMQVLLDTAVLHLPTVKVPSKGCPVSPYCPLFVYHKPAGAT